MKSSYVNKIAISGLLIAVGIVIPMFSPLKFVMEPASFTLGSHIAVFIAMFISPAVAVAVAAGTTLGFFLGGFPFVIVLRAASHVVFALVGALYLQRNPISGFSYAKAAFYSLIVALIHAFCELFIVTVFYRIGGVGASYYDYGFLRSVMLLVGLGTVIHSMVDFAIAYAITLTLNKTKLLPGV